MVKKKRKKRRRAEHDEEDEEGLDEDDLDLVKENTGVEVTRSSRVGFSSGVLNLDTKACRH